MIIEGGEVRSGDRVIVKPKDRKVRLYVREWRKFRKMTLAELGEKLGKEKITVSRWERNIYPMSVDQLGRIAEILDCTVVDLLTRAPDGSL
jgi:transcriptional regulator with XRE-family HTH domain